MNSSPTCPTCGATVAASSPHGLCPACLLRAGMPSGTQPPPQRERWTPPSPAELAAAFPQLEIGELIGQGGMGAVYRARQPNLDRIVALKILPPDEKRDPGFAERFTREARALAKLGHPNIVAIHDFGTSGGYHYLVMEHVDGATLRQLLLAGRIAAREALAIVPAICDALQYAHDRGIVHRDIKPENILLDRRGAVKIADFGLAKLVGTDPAELGLTGERDVMGTPHYMAPEQVERPLEVDHRADIFSLGVVFYQMLTGELPLGRFEAPSRRVQVDVRLDEVVLRALEKEPSRRYPQASALKTEVETIATTSAPAPTPPTQSAGPRRPLVIALFVVAAMGIAALVSTTLRLKNEAVEAQRRLARTSAPPPRLSLPAAAATTPWGNPVNDLAVRLIPERTQWREGETPRFVVEVRSSTPGMYAPLSPERSTLTIESPPVSPPPGSFTMPTTRLHSRSAESTSSLPLMGGPNVKTVTLVLRLTDWVDREQKTPRLTVGHHRVRYSARFESPDGRTGFNADAVAEIDVVGDAPPVEPAPMVTIIPDHLTWRTDETPSFRVEMQSRLTPHPHQLEIDGRLFQPRARNLSSGTPRYFAPDKSALVVKLDADWIDSNGLAPTLKPGRHQVTFRAAFGARVVAGAGVTIEIVATPLAGDPEFDAGETNPAILQVELRKAQREQARVTELFRKGLVPQMELVLAEERAALIEARIAHDRVRFAEVKVKAAERRLAETMRLSRMGAISQSEVRATEDALAVEKIRLEDAQKHASGSP